MTPANLSRPSPARIVDYFLGGDNNFAVDRQEAQGWEAVYPEVREAYRAARSFLNRAVSYAIWKADIDRFLGFESGLPTCGNIHEVALFHAPHARVVYSDQDPGVVEWGQRFLAGVGLDNVRYVRGDIMHAGAVLEHPDVVSLLGEDRKLGIALSAFLHRVDDEALANALQRIYDLVPPGSHLLVSFSNEENEYNPAFVAKRRALGTYHLRSNERMVELLGKWQVTPHGVCYTAMWPSRQEPEAWLRLGSALVAYKPEN